MTQTYKAIWRRKIADTVDDNAGVYHAHAHLWEAGNWAFAVFPLFPGTRNELTAAEAHATKRLTHVRLCMLPIVGPKPQWTRLELPHLTLCSKCKLRTEHWYDIQRNLASP